jgi:hypothetical protein
MLTMQILIEGKDYGIRTPVRISADETMVIVDDQWIPGDAIAYTKDGRRWEAGAWVSDSFCKPSPEEGREHVRGRTFYAVS